MPILERLQTFVQYFKIKILTIKIFCYAYDNGQNKNK